MRTPLCCLVIAAISNHTDNIHTPIFLWDWWKFKIHREGQLNHLQCGLSSLFLGVVIFGCKFAMADLGITDERRILTVQDFVESSKLQSISTEREAGLAAFSLKSYNLSTDKSKSDIFIHDSKTLKTTQYTRNEWGTSCYQPLLAVNMVPGAEDQLLFLKKGQLFSIPLQGGEAGKVTNFPLAVESCKLFKNESCEEVWLAFVLNVFADKTPIETVEYDATLPPSPGQSSGVIFDKLMVRHWDNWGTYKKRHHLFVCPLSVNSSGLFEADLETARDLMFGLETDCPGKGPGQGEEEYAISPDGSTFAVACRRSNPDGSQVSDMAWTTDVPIYIGSTTPPSHSDSVEGGAAAQRGLRIVSGDDWRGYNSKPTFSPDGAYLAFTSMARGGYESDKSQIRVLHLASGSVSAVTASVDLSFESIEWGAVVSSPSPSTEVGATYVIFAAAQFRGSTRIFRLTLSTGSGGGQGDQGGAECSLASLDVMAGDQSHSSPLVVQYRGPLKGKTQGGGDQASEAFYFAEASLTTPPQLKLAVVDPASGGMFTPFDEEVARWAATLSVLPVEVPLGTNPSRKILEVI